MSLMVLLSVRGVEVLVICELMTYVEFMFESLAAALAYDEVENAGLSAIETVVVSCGWACPETAPADDVSCDGIC